AAAVLADDPARDGIDLHEGFLGVVEEPYFVGRETRERTSGVGRPATRTGIDLGERRYCESEKEEQHRERMRPPASHAHRSPPFAIDPPAAGPRYACDNRLSIAAENHSRICRRRRVTERDRSLGRIYIVNSTYCMYKP